MSSPRTDANSVKGICVVRSQDDLTPFILTANTIVSAVCVPTVVSNKRPAYPDATLELIERWLSAHYYSIMRPQRKLESAGSVQASYDSTTDLGLNVTRYGQAARTICYNGYLAAWSNTLEFIKGRVAGGVYTIGMKYVGGSPSVYGEIPDRTFKLVGCGSLNFGRTFI